METNKKAMTVATESLFRAIVSDMGNWGMTPPCYNHITWQSRGNLTDLKKRGLVTTFESDGEEWIQVTETGMELARELRVI